VVGFRRRGQTEGCRRRTRGTAVLAHGDSSGLKSERCAERIMRRGYPTVADGGRSAPRKGVHAAGEADTIERLLLSRVRHVVAVV
jgi:hypothetical protein